MAIKRVRVGKKRHAWVKWAVAAAIVLAVGVSFAASVGVGNWLLQTAEKYPAGEQETQTALPEQEILPVSVFPIKAHSYGFGNRYSSYVYAGITQLCAPLCGADGSPVYDSAVCERAGWETCGSVDLAENMLDLHQNGLYVSAYMPIDGFAEPDAALRELALSYEAALIAEAAAAGVDEIFLTGLAPTQANITAVLQYLRRIKSLAGNCAIGVLIEPEVLLAADYDVYTAAQLLQVCDFLVLDLRSLPLTATEPETETQGESETQLETETQTEQGGTQLTVTTVLEQMQYDLQRYSPRLALDTTQTDALDLIIAKGYGNWVIMESTQTEQPMA